MFTICRGKPPDKTRTRSTRLCLEENQKTNLDPPYVCPKLQVQATFYCQHLLLRNWFHFLFLKETKINTCTIYLFLIFLKYKMHEIEATKACMYFVATV